MGELESRWLFCAVVAAVAVQRLVELRVSARHERRLRARGAVEAGAGHYPWMVALHTGLLIAAPLEVWLLGRPLLAALALVSAVALAAATGLRYWTIRTLGERWTTRVLYLPGSEAIGGGPFRLLRHPNYLAVMVETVALPLLHTAWLTAAVFGALNALLLRQRIRVEEGVLRRHTRYAEVFSRRAGEPP